MEVTLDQNKRYTYADCLTWPEGFRCEIINGAARKLPPVNTAHARVCSILMFLLYSFIKEKDCKCQVYSGIFDVRLPKNGKTAYDKIDTVVQPDICVVCDLSKLDDLGCIGAPDLIVEVLSPSTLKNDWNYKFNLYEKSGVREYWIVDPKAKMVSVFLLQADGKYDNGAFYECNQKAPVFIFEGLEIDLNELFEE